MTKTLILDSHIHLDTQVTLRHSLALLQEKLNEAQVDGGFVIHLDSDPWSYRDLCEKVLELPNLNVFVNLNLNQTKKEIERDLGLFKNLGVLGIKIHPRRQKLSLKEPKLHFALELVREFHLKVNICSFDDGSWSRISLEAQNFLSLADRYPEIPFLWSHAGGYRVIEFMMMARRTTNVYLDTSFTQDYFFKGSVKEDLSYATESLPGRYMFGTDTDMDNYVEVVNRNLSYFNTLNNDCTNLFSGNLTRFTET